jgi:hypothetical protein
MLRALKTKLANFMRAQVAIVTEPKIEAMLAALRSVLAEQQVLRQQITELSKMRPLIEQNVRATENERRDMDETQRMVGVACARIENFIKVQKEHSAAMEQSIASLLENRVRITETA